MSHPGDALATLGYHRPSWQLDALCADVNAEKIRRERGRPGRVSPGQHPTPGTGSAVSRWGRIAADPVSLRKVYAIGSREGGDR